MPFITTSQKKQFHYTDSHPQGPPLADRSLAFIFIHGLGTSQSFFFPILPCLTGRHRCIVFDLSGCGRSPLHHADSDRRDRYYQHLQQEQGRPGEEDKRQQSIGTIAADVLGILDALKIEKTIVVGHSMGGIVASCLAAHFPDRVIAVVEIGPVHPSPSTGGVFEKRIQIVSEDGMEPLANTLPEASTGSRSTPLVKAFYRELLLNQNPEGYASLCRVVSTARPPDYSAVKAPFLLIAGEEDKSAPLDNCKHIFANIASPNKKLVVLPSVGHMHCIEASDQVGRLLMTFADTVSV